MKLTLDFHSTLFFQARQASMSTYWNWTRLSVGFHFITRPKMGDKGIYRLIFRWHFLKPSRISLTDKQWFLESLHFLLFFCPKQEMLETFFLHLSIPYWMIQGILSLPGIEGYEWVPARFARFYQNICFYLTDGQLNSGITGIQLYAKSGRTGIQLYAKLCSVFPGWSSQIISHIVTFKREK
jgi:hypothetical protein